LCKVSGFRPFIYRIAKKANVRGYIRNRGGAEVEIYIEGSRGEIEKFFKYFWKEKPESFIIDKVHVEKVEPLGYEDFRILKSSSIKLKRSAIPPDFAVCDECLREVLNINDYRRYRYAFNSCVVCGPRFSMMYNTPWDRENTAMKDFPLCKDCLAEYEDPNNIRRFHAQGISCKICGPKLWLVDRNGERIECEDPIRETAKLIDEGYIVAIKGIGGFHIACLASDDDVVLKLRRRKRRPEKPFAVMVLDVDVGRRLAYIDDYAEKILKSVQRPIVLLPVREDSPLSRYVAPGLAHVGIFLPYTPLHYLILMELKDRFAIMTSGNVHGKPMCIDNNEALKKLKDIVDYFLLHNREIVNRVDDSVLRISNRRAILLRRSRGYAPYWIKVPLEIPEDTYIIAVGALLQNVGAIMFEDKVVLTQYIGDCDDFETLEDLRKYIFKIMNMLRIEINDKSIVVSDLHPQYDTTRLASEISREFNIKHVKVQHHWAHIASAMADYGIHPDREVIGIAIDGVGFGEDGNIWGGEILIAKYDNYVRIGHLKYVKMLGGDLATEYPARMVLSYLAEVYGIDEACKILIKTGLTKYLKYGVDEIEILSKLYEREKIYTSSTGRFLDAVSTLLGICGVRTYEGEPAMKLEACGLKARRRSIDIEFPIVYNDGKYVIDTVEAFRQVYEYYIEGLDICEIAYAVQYNLGRAFGKICKILSNRSRNIVVMSGGAAVNEIIMKGVEDEISNTGLKLILPSKVPVNDGGISFGQAVIVAGMLNSGKL